MKAEITKQGLVQIELVHVEVEHDDAVILYIQTEQRHLDVGWGSDRDDYYFYFNVQGDNNSLTTSLKITLPGKLGWTPFSDNSKSITHLGLFKPNKSARSLLEAK